MKGIKNIMKRFFLHFEKTILFLLKLMMFASIMIIFFLMFLEVSMVGGKFELLRPSRTAAIAYPTFAVLGLLLIRIYGGWQIGELKSREIIRSVALATFFCDIVTFFQISIMLRQINAIDIWKNLGLLLVAFLAQFIIIIAFTRFGNFIYFKANDPEKTLIIYGDDELIDSQKDKVAHYKKQWKISRVLKYDALDIKKAIRDHEAVFIFNIPKTNNTEIIEYCYKHHKKLYFSPNVEEIIIKHTRYTVVDDMVIFTSSIRGLTIEQLAIKRLFDIIFSLAILLITSPLMLIQAIAIKITDGGKVIYKQDRLTRNNTVFQLLKFRTMIPNAEKNNNPQLSPKNDPRVTKIGKILRKTRLDELPQLINILKGDMSFVGPRPERKKVAQTLEHDLPEFRYRVKVKAGLTGTAQIWGKYNTTLRDKLILDLMYIENYSIWLDLQLVLQTFKVFFKSDSTEGFNKDALEEFERMMKKK